MTNPSRTEKLFLEEMSKISMELKRSIGQLKIGDLIRLIRVHLKMSQRALAKRAKLPSSTVSRIELSKATPNLSTLSKIFESLSCSLVTAPVLNESIETIRQKQAQFVAKKRILYLIGTMDLEKQKPDNKFIEDLIKQEEERLLNGSGKELWEG